MWVCVCVCAVEVVDVNCFLDGETALMLAAAAGNSTCVQLLLQYGADVNLSSCCSDPPLIQGRLILLFYVCHHVCHRPSVVCRH